MELRGGAPLKGALLEQYRQLLARDGLDYAPGIEFTAALLEGSVLVAAGSLAGNVLVCLVADDAHREGGLGGTLLTALTQEAFRRGLGRLFLYTKPENRARFEGLLFYPVVQTAQALLMENVRGGVDAFLRSLGPAVAGEVGAAVVNCDPFTLGHRCLLETAAAQCDLLHVFVLSEEAGLLPAATRLRLVREGTADLKNIRVHDTGGYLISRATFPTYFLKDQADGARVCCELDVELFLTRFVPSLGITRRFVGTEPLCPVTAAYNAYLKQQLPPRGVAVTEIHRLEKGGAPVSASTVRALLGRGDWAGLRPLVPDVTWNELNGRAHHG